MTSSQILTVFSFALFCSFQLVFASSTTEAIEIVNRCVSLEENWNTCSKLKVGYNSTDIRFQQLSSRTDVAEGYVRLKPVIPTVPGISPDCDVDTVIMPYVCSFFAPPCLEDYFNQTKPCREYCEYVNNTCYVGLLKIAESYEEHLRLYECHKYPSINDGDVCFYNYTFINYQLGKPIDESMVTQISTLPVDNRRCVPLKRDFAICDELKVGYNTTDIEFVVQSRAADLKTISGPMFKRIVSDIPGISRECSIEKLIVPYTCASLAPPCNSSGQAKIHPCREYCKYVKEFCGVALERINEVFSYYSDLYNCNDMPSIYESIACYNNGTVVNDFPVTTSTEPPADTFQRVEQELKKQRLDFFNTSFHLKALLYLSFETSELKFNAKLETLDPLSMEPVDPAFLRSNESKQHIVVEFRDQNVIDWTKFSFTIIGVDADVALSKFGSSDRPFLHWVRTGLTASMANSKGNVTLLEGFDIKPYVEPHHLDGDSAHRYFFLLFRQNRDQIVTNTNINRFAEYEHSFCNVQFIGRCRFNLAEFVHEQQLEPVAITWVRVGTTPYVLWRQASPENANSLSECSRREPNFRQCTSVSASSIVQKAYFFKIMFLVLVVVLL